MKEIYNLPLEIQMKIMKFTPHPLSLLMKPLFYYFEYDIILDNFSFEYFRYLFYQPGLRCKFPLSNNIIPHVVRDHFNC